MRQRYTIVIERAPGNFSAYVPDVPGCIATGPSAAETSALLAEALTDHLAVMAEYGDEIPAPLTDVRDVRPVSADDIITTIDVEMPASPALV